ncbi:MAG TPA: hypothetical protein VK557_01560 [Pyrinomonadaceae bacterium]|nr:hypothetical protein [Pyrinomonadaceae bacterium]
MSEIVTSEVLADPAVHRLIDLRLGLLRLHKALLEMERIDYEKIHGQVNSGELLQLVLDHPQFSWLRMLSALVVEIDEALDADEPATLSDCEALISQARLLLTSPESEEFKTRYQAALQREPAVVVAHSAVIQLLRKKTD